MNLFILRHKAGTLFFFCLEQGLITQSRLDRDHKRDVTMTLKYKWVETLNYLSKLLASRHPLACAPRCWTNTVHFSLASCLVAELQRNT